MFEIGLILRTLGVLQLTVLAVLMLRARRRDDVGRIGAALCMSVAAFLLTSSPGASKVFGVLGYPLTAVCSSHPVWFWLFCAALFADRPRLSVRHLVCVGAMAVAGIFFNTELLPAGGLRETGSAIVASAALVFICLGPWTVFAGHSMDLDERRRRLRAWFVPPVSVYLGIAVVAQLLAQVSGASIPKPLVLANLLFINGVVAIVLLTFTRVRVVNWLDLIEPTPPRAKALTRGERRVLERLNTRFAAEKLYAQEGLSIARLATLLDTQEHVLRRVINRGLAFRNFNDFLHSHRLPAAAARLRDPAEQRTPVLTIALEVGYGSVGPFNRAFKQRFGLTPTEYRAETRSHGNGASLVGVRLNH